MKLFFFMVVMVIYLFSNAQIYTYEKMLASKAKKVCVDVVTADTLWKDISYSYDHAVYIYNSSGKLSLVEHFSPYLSNKTIVSWDSLGRIVKEISIVFTSDTQYIDSEYTYYYSSKYIVKQSNDMLVMYDTAGSILYSNIFGRNEVTLFMGADTINLSYNSASYDGAFYIDSGATVVIRRKVDESTLKSKVYMNGKGNYEAFTKYDSLGRVVKIYDSGYGWQHEMKMEYGSDTVWTYSGVDTFISAKAIGGNGDSLTYTYSLRNKDFDFLMVKNTHGKVLKEITYATDHRIGAKRFSVFEYDKNWSLICATNSYRGNNIRCKEMVCYTYEY